MTRPPAWFALALVSAFASASAFALDKVDPYICPTASAGSGIDCFLEAVPQTYTMCRQVKSIEVLEFGLTGAQEGVNGAKTDYCIEKHKLSIARPYQAALKEAGRQKEAGEHLRKLHDLWLESLSKLIPDASETDDGYKQRVVRPYGAFNEEIAAIRVAQTDKLGVKPLIAKGEMRKSKINTAKVDATRPRVAAKAKRPLPAKKPVVAKTVATPAAPAAKP